MKKVLVIHHCDTVGGSSLSIGILLNELKNKFDIRVLSPKGSSSNYFKKIGLKTYYIPKFFEFASLNNSSYRWPRLFLKLPRLKSFSEIKKISNHEKYDVIHFNEVTCSLLLFYLRKNESKKIVHIRAVSNKRYPIMNWIVKHILNKYADEVIFIDKSVEQSYKGVMNSRIIYNPSRKSKPLKKEKCKEFNVLFLGLLSRSKGILDYLELAKMNKDNLKIKFFLAGNFSEINRLFNFLPPFILQWLKKKIDMETISKSIINENDLKNVRILGFVKDLMPLLKKTDLIVFPSYFDGVGRSVFELGIHGIPSIVYLKNSLEDIVEDKKTGYIIDPGDVNAMNNVLNLMSHDKILYNELSNNCIIKYRNQHSPIKNALLLENSYLDCFL